MTITKQYEENKVQLIGTISRGKFYNNGDNIEVNVLVDRNGYEYRVKLEDNALVQKVLTLTGKVAITGKLRIYDGNVCILANEVIDIENE